MLRNAFILCCATICAVLSAMAVIHYGTPTGDQAVMEPAYMTAQVTPAAVTSGHVTAIPKAADGHFWAEARVNDRAVRFLVDTGATVVALTPADAQRLGVNLKALSFDRTVMTASGQTQAAEVVLASVGIGDSRVSEVEALVIREGLSTSLLGMSYLGKLSRIEATPSTLILHP
jgi:aspartyl protease family protein